MIILHRAAGVGLDRPSLVEALLGKTCPAASTRQLVGTAAADDPLARLEQLRQDANAQDHPPRDVVLYGFGRIGRLLARTFIERQARRR